MNKKNHTYLPIVAVTALVLLYSFTASAQVYDLVKAYQNKSITIANRSVTLLPSSDRAGLHTDERTNDGVIWVSKSDFTTGGIDVDIRGKNKPGENFIGVAFHGVNDSTFDVVYFRPFNFQSDDPEHKAHQVQFCSPPDYSWYRLRTEHPGVYENALSEPVDPDQWFHARIIVTDTDVTVYVNKSSTPSLHAQLLNARKGGKVGLWVGYKSGGDFSDLSFSK